MRIWFILWSCCWWSTSALPRVWSSFECCFTDFRILTPAGNSGIIIGLNVGSRKLFWSFTLKTSLSIKVDSCLTHGSVLNVYRPCFRLADSPPTLDNHSVHSTSPCKPGLSPYVPSINVVINQSDDSSQAYSSWSNQLAPTDHWATFQMKHVTRSPQV